jgi:hypothetical protein
MSSAGLRARLRAIYVKLTSFFMKQHFLKTLVFTAETHALSAFERHFSSSGWLVSKVESVSLAEGSVIHPVPLLISLLFTAFFAIATIIGRDITMGIITALFIFISLMLYSVRPVVAITNIDGGYIIVADPEEGYLSAISFLKNIGGEIIEEKNLVDKGIPIPQILQYQLDELKKAYEKAKEYAETRAATTAIQPRKAETATHTAPSAELAMLLEEATKWREYLEKLEELKNQGKISEYAYRELKREYSNKLEELEKKIEKLKKASG